MTLLEALGPGRLISIIGGGGKTSLMFELAREAGAAGRDVITTTTTKIRVPPPSVSKTILLEGECSEWIGKLQGQLRAEGHLTLGREILPGEKLIGLEAEQVDLIAEELPADLILVEADGSAGRSLKAHAAHEPVIPLSTELVILVIGIDCLGAELDDRAVHRAVLLSERLGSPMGSRIRAEDVAAIVHHPKGYLARVPETARVLVLLNKVEDGRGEAEALRCAEALYSVDAAGRLDRVVIGRLQGVSPWLRIVSP